MDYTTIHPASVNKAHRVDLHLWRGAPQPVVVERDIIYYEFKQAFLRPKMRIFIKLYS